MDRRRSFRAALVLCLIASVPAHAADGTLDSSFAGDGKQTVGFNIGQDNHDRGQAVAGFGGGRIVVVGDIQRSTAGDLDFGVVALEPDGDPDLLFSVDGKTQIFFDLGADKADVSHAVAAMRDGGVAVCGTANYSAPSTNESRLVVARLDVEGFADSGFGANGKVVLTPFDHDDSSNTDCRSIVALDDGRVVVPFVNEQYLETGLIRLEADGDPDPTFAGDGISELPFCGSASNACRLHKVLLLPGGKYMAIGDKVVQLGPGVFATRLFFARYTSGGLLDSTFNNDGQATVSVPLGDVQFETPMDAALDPAGRVVVLEHADGLVTDDYYLVRIDSNGDVDETFGTSGWTHVELSADTEDVHEANGLLIQGDGKIVVTGYYQFNGPDYDCLAVRFNATATALDTTFGIAGRRAIAFDLGNTADTDQCNEVSAADGRPLLAGQVMVGTSFDFAAARLTNAYIFIDGFESGFRYFWSRSAP